MNWISGSGIRAALAVGGLAALAGCGSDEYIDVTRLPPGDANGSVGTGYYQWVETVRSSDCLEEITIGGETVALPVTGDSWEASATVTQNEGYFRVDLAGFGGDEAPPGVVRADFVVDGGIWQEGQFRVGGLFAFAEGVNARILMDGLYSAPPPECRGVVRSFQGPAIVQVEAIDPDAEEDPPYICQFEVWFTGDRGGCI